ncbi:hypothetical protein Trydic_g6683 [Trypoxylus dichotomus]
MRCGIVGIAVLVLIGITVSDQQKQFHPLNVKEVFKRDAAPISSSTTAKNMMTPKIVAIENKQIESSKLRKKKKSEDIKKNDGLASSKVSRTAAKSGVTISYEDFKSSSDERVKNKDHSNIEIIPKQEKHEEKSAIKRNPKDISSRLGQIDSELADGETDINHGKPSLPRGLKRTRVDNSETVLGETKPVKPLKPLILPRKHTMQTAANSCATPAVKKQMEIVKDRLFKVIERMDQATVNCVALNNEIETIRTILQHALHKTPESRHRDVDKSKILDQLRERQAKIHARFGRLELVKPKHSLVGSAKDVEIKTPTEDE